MKRNVLRYIKNILLVLLIIGSIVAAAMANSVINVMKEAPQVDFSGISESLGETSVIIDSDDNVIEEVKSADYREIKPIEEIPDHVKKAFVAIEDERFYTHTGVDAIGIARSLLDNIMAGGIVRGGSTITQQLVRDLYLNDEKTMDRKVKEAYIALKMDAALNKDEILEIYLNRIFLGQNSYGVQQASKTYFSKDVEDLSIAEASALAALPQAPSEYSLYNSIPADSVSEDDQVIDELIINGEKYFAVYNDAAEDRQGYVLDKMLELGYISQAEYDEAKSVSIAEDLKPAQRQNDSKTSFITAIVKDQVASDLMTKFSLSEDEAMDMLYNGGLKIESSIDFDMQNGLTEELENFIDMVSSYSGEGSSSTRFMNLSLDDAGNVLNSDEDIIYYDKYNIFDDENDIHLSPESYRLSEEGLFINNRALSYQEGAILVEAFYTTSEGNFRTHAPTRIGIHPEDISEREDGSILISKNFLDSNEGFYMENENGLFISHNYYNIDETGTIQPQTSIVVMDQATGHIKAIIGGRETNSGLNRAYQIVRQPGSTMKPIAVYMPALDNGMTLASPIDDLPRKEGERLWPINWYGEYRGLTSLRISLETSSNVNAVNTLEKVTIAKSKDYLSKLGLINKEDPQLDHFISKAENPDANDENTAAMALGAMNYGFSNLEMTSAYAAIANKGTYIEPRAYTRVYDRNGRVILENEAKENKVVDEDIAFLIQDAMRSTTERGVARNAQIQGFDVAGKTGTSGTEELDLDSWFIGYTPYYTVGLWIGPDNQQLKINSISDITTSIWREVNQYILKNHSPKKFTKPDGIVEVEVCNQSGKLPTDLCYQDPRGTTLKEYFKKGTEPKTKCTAHVILAVNANDGLLWSDSNSLFSKVERLFVQTDSEFDPEEFGGLVPTDWQYRAPTEYSTEKGLIDSIFNPDDEDSEETDETEADDNNQETETETEAPPVDEPADTEAETEAPETDDGGSED